MSVSHAQSSLFHSTLFTIKELSRAMGKVIECMMVRSLGDICIDVGVVIVDPDEEGE